MKDKLNLSFEVLTIIECCKENPSKKNLIAYCANITNWNDFIYNTTCHGLLPLIYLVLKDMDIPLPPNAIATLRSMYFKIAKENMHLSSELIKLSNILDKNDINYVSFKGPVLSSEAYGNITFRQYSDLDILVNKEDIYKVSSLLKDEYKRSLPLTGDKEKIWLEYAHDIGLTNKLGIHVECHWSMLDSDDPVDIKGIDFLDGRKKIQIKNNDIYAISNEKFLIYLCIHGSKHLYERVEWVLDIHKFIKTHEIDWDEIDRLLSKTNSQKFFFLGLYLAKTLFNTEISNKYFKEFDSKIFEIKNHIFAIWNKDKEFSNKNNIKYMLKLFDNKYDKLKYINKKYFKPTFSEYWYISFPRQLYFLYYPLRQYLLIKKYFFTKN